MDLSVTTLPDNQEDLVEFRFKRGSTRPFSGRSQLAQQFAILLLKDPSADRFSFGIGAGLRREIINAGSGADLDGICSSAIASAESQMIEAQAESGVTYTLQETLKSATLKDLDIVDSSNGVVVKLSVSLVSRDNRSTVFPINITELNLGG